MTYDASNRKDIRRAEKEARAQEVARIDYLKAAMTMSQGRHWFHDLLEFCGVTVCAPVYQTNQDYFAMGMRNVGLSILNDITTHCPDDYIKMMKEANGRRIERDIRDQHDHDHRDAASELNGSEDAGWDVEGRESDDSNYVNYGTGVESN